MFFEILAFTLPTGPELVEAVPIILALIVIEGLLSVDNALAIAAMANHLPEKQKYLALKLGIIGAYFFRGVCLAFAAWIIENPWLKIVGSAYLVYLMCHHFTAAHAAQQQSGELGGGKKRGLVGTIVAIEIMDLSLSVDNVVAAVAMSDKLWVVCTGVFIGILALRFVAGACIRVIEKYPVLAHTAFILIGYVGFILLFELLTNPKSGIQVFPGPVKVTVWQKFIGIVLIMAASLSYAKSPALQKALRPLFAIAQWPMRLVDAIVGLALKIVLLPFQLLLLPFRKKSAA